MTTSALASKYNTSFPHGLSPRVMDELVVHKSTHETNEDHPASAAQLHKPQGFLAWIRSFLSDLSALRRKATEQYC